MGRVTQEVWYNSGGTAVETLTFDYDDNGNLTSAGNSHGTYTLTLDALNRPTVVKGLFGTTLTMTYDPLGNRTVLEDNFGGVMTSTYNKNNQLTSRQFGGAGQTPLRIDYTYNSRNLLATAKRYSDLAATTKIGESEYSYDTSGRLENLHHKNGSGGNIANFTWTYDKASRVTSETLNSTTNSYTYDNTNQLTNDGTNAFSYDANGNRNMTGYTTGTGNQITNDGVFTYTHDAEGNLTKRSKAANDETWTYGWDHRNQLTWVEERATDGGTLLMRAEYDYDVFGNRIQEAIDADGAGAGGTVTTRFALDGWKVDLNGSGFIGNENWDVWADLDDTNSLTMRRIYTDRIDDVVARINSSGTAAWYLTDRQGSVRNITDNSGTVQNTIAYDGFGGVTSESSPSNGDRYKYTGREQNGNTELQYNRGRYYSTAIGKWISEDPIGFGAEDLNLYRYVGNNTTNLRDASGYQADNKSFTQLVQEQLRWIRQDSVRPFPRRAELERRIQRKEKIDSSLLAAKEKKEIVLFIKVEALRNRWKAGDLSLTRKKIHETLSAEAIVRELRKGLRDPETRQFAFGYMRSIYRTASRATAQLNPGPNKRQILLETERRIGTLVFSLMANDQPGWNTVVQGKDKEKFLVPANLNRSLQIGKPPGNDLVEIKKATRGWIERLGNRRFVERETAEGKLKGLLTKRPKVVREILEEALKNTKDLEIKKRIRGILGK